MIVVMTAAYALPIGAVWFWVSWLRRERIQPASWRAVLGALAAAFATLSIIWFHVFPHVLQRHYLQAGGEDQGWWALALLSVRIGTVLSLCGISLSFFGTGRTRILSLTSSAAMLLAWVVAWSMR